MNPLLVDIKDMLTAEISSLHPLTLGDNLHISRMPETPTNCVSLYDTSSSPSQMTMDDAPGTDIKNGSFQVLVRNTGWMACYEQAAAIEEVLQGKANELWNNTYYLFIEKLSGPMQLMSQQDGISQKNPQYLLSMNFTVKRSKQII